MARTLLRTSSGLMLLLGALAAPLAAQGNVDLRVNLSTQPVYAPFSRMAMDYLQLPSLYATGNIRGGRAFMGNRNFLEDRYFDSSLSRFYRDSTGVSDVSHGAYYGPGQAMYRPGSLSTSSSSVGQYTFSRPAPYGAMSYNPSAALLPSPYASFTSIRLESLEPSAAQYPSATAVRAYLQRTMGSEEESQTALPLLPYVRTESATEPKSRLEAYLESLMPSGPEFPDASQSAMPGEIPEGAEPALRGEEAAPTAGVRPVDFLRRRFAEQAPLLEAPAERSDWSLFEPLDIKGLPEDVYGEPPEAELTLPDMEGVASARPARHDEQYLELARLDMRIGAYRQAAEAYAKAADFNPLRRWEAASGEGVARLLVKDYYLAAYLLKYVIVTKPERLRKDFRLTEVVDRPEEWQATERALAEEITKSPRSAQLAFCMAYLKIFSGRAGEAEPHLKVAEQSQDYAQAVTLLREKAMP